MRLLLLALALTLAACDAAGPDVAADALADALAGPVSHSVIDHDFGPIVMSIDHAEDDLDGPTYATVTVAPGGRSAGPLPASVTFGTDRSATTLPLLADRDGTASARGLVPAPKAVASLAFTVGDQRSGGTRVTFATGALTTGESTSVVTVETAEGKARGTTTVTVEARCCPAKVVVTTGVIVDEEAEHI